ncbi:MAG: lipoate--protein ligase [Lentilactobacillus hilgardii]|uniref:lipoate--protein ligase family protein n=1 Tax=Lentilactobacillus hilgardii TaxID=1588 RepID=UPI0039ECB56A
MSFTNTPITVIKQAYSPAKKLISFADTNALLDYCDQFQRPFIHFWTTDQPTLILGINDRHLPNLTAGLQNLTANKYDYFLRNSGGLAVISDPGVLNISLFIPDADRKLDVDDSYDIIADLMMATFPTLSIQTFEVTHSYCPGKYDLSVNGQKIAGIAQRRSKGAVALMLYLSVEGDQDARSNVVSEFYQAGDAYSQTRWAFPQVDKTTMTTVEKIGFPNIDLLTVEQHFLKSVSQQMMSLDLDSQAQLLRSDTFIDLRKKQLRKIQLRNQQLPLI